MPHRDEPGVVGAVVATRVEVDTHGVALPVGSEMRECYRIDGYPEDTPDLPVDLRRALPLPLSESVENWIMKLLDPLDVRLFLLGAMEVCLHALLSACQTRLLALDSGIAAQHPLLFVGHDLPFKLLFRSGRIEISPLDEITC